MWTPRTQPTCFPSTRSGRMRAPTSISSSQLSVISVFTSSTSLADGGGRKTPSLIWRMMSIPRDDSRPRVNLVGIFLVSCWGDDSLLDGRFLAECAPVRCRRSRATHLGIPHHLALRCERLLNLLSSEFLLHLAFNFIHDLVALLFNLGHTFHKLAWLRCFVESHGRETLRSRHTTLV